MKLYYSPGACSLSPHIALQEAGLAYTPVLASTKSHKLQDGTDYYTINALGYVPVLELDNGERLREGPAIVQYIADQVPDKQLAPANGTLARYRLQERLLQRLQWVDGQLAGKQYLMGDQFTVADGYLFTVTNWTQPTKLDISGLANLAAYRERVGARPAVQAAMKAEGLLK